MILLLWRKNWSVTDSSSKVALVQPEERRQGNDEKSGKQNKGCNVALPDGRRAAGEHTRAEGFGIPPDPDDNPEYSGTAPG